MDVSYLISKTLINDFNHYLTIGDIYVQTNITNFWQESGLHREVVVLGDFIDFRQPEAKKSIIVQKLAECIDYIELIKESEFWVGRYIIISNSEEEGLRVAGDATGTIPVYYTNSEDNNYLIASHAVFIQKILDLRESETAKQVRKMAMEQQQPLPNDMTMYSEVKILLPNHYLLMNEGMAIRYFPVNDLPEVSVEEAVETTVTIGQKVADYLFENYQLAIAMTSGLDSRLVLSYFKEKEDIALYTYVHENFDEETADVAIPKKISKTFDIPYYPLPRKKLSKDITDQITKKLPGQINQRILENAYTFSSSQIEDRNFITGDIIPLAKSNFGQNLPESLATTEYFTTKSHNYSKLNKAEIKRWLDEARAIKNTNISLYDLFFWENRWGRWFTNNVANYDIFSSGLYMFNSRYLIKMWLSVSRKERVKKVIHKEVIRKNWPELLDIPINPDSSIIDKLSSNQWVYYFGSFLKHYVKKHFR